MRAQRLAAFLRQLAELDRQRADLCLALADELGDVDQADVAAVEKRSPRRRSRPKILPPESPPSEMDIARARRALRRAGLVGSKG